MNAVTYVIVRYRPMVDTGEFANVGVICFALDSLDIRYRLAPTRYRRVTQFFDNVAPESYANAMTFLKHELQRLIGFTREDRRERTELAFSFFTRRREGVLQFSQPRSIIGESVDAVADQLYDRLVRRVESGPPQREAGLAQSIGRDLRAANVRSFKARVIDDPIMPVRLPLVSGRASPFVIKPIAFDQKSTIGIVDHAALWHDRFEYFLDKGILSKDRILLPVEYPREFEDESFRKAFDLAVRKIESLRVEVVPLDRGSEQRILRFAQDGDLQRGGLH